MDRASSSVSPTVTAPWLAMNAALLCPKASHTLSARSGVPGKPYFGYFYRSADIDGHLVYDGGQVNAGNGEDAGIYGVGMYDGANVGPPLVYAPRGAAFGGRREVALHGFYLEIRYHDVVMGECVVGSPEGVTAMRSRPFSGSSLTLTLPAVPTTRPSSAILRAASATDCL